MHAFISHAIPPVPGIVPGNNFLFLNKYKSDYILLSVCISTILTLSPSLRVVWLGYLLIGMLNVSMTMRLS